jgi:hypothetical protein
MYNGQSFCQADSHREKLIKIGVLRISFKYESQFFASVSIMAEELFISSFAKNCESVFLPQQKH